jgi:hypothetical protein
MVHADNNKTHTQSPDRDFFCFLLILAWPEAHGPEKIDLYAPMLLSFETQQQQQATIKNSLISKTVCAQYFGLLFLHI